MIDWIDEAFRGPAWHGPALMTATRGVSDRLAVWRPARGRHNIAEEVLHAAYWKHIVRQRLGGMRERFPLNGRNWFARNDPAEWRDDLRVLVEAHEALRQVVAGLGPRSLGRVVHAGQTAEDNVRGIAMHDVYHAGQIQLLKKMAGQRS